MVRVDVLEKVRAYWIIYCPVCGEKMYPIGIDMNPFWCKKCEQSYWLELRKANHTKEQLKEVMGFPKTSESKKDS